MGVSLIVDVYYKGVGQQRLEFSSDTHHIVRIGRLHSAQIRLDDPLVSRIHAIVEMSPTQALLVDMGAEPGTTVNARRVQKQKLAHGDQVTIGDTVLMVGLGAAPAAVSAPAAAPAATATTATWSKPAPTYTAPAPAPAQPAPVYAAPVAAPAYAAPTPAYPAAPSYPSAAAYAPQMQAMPVAVQQLAAKIAALSPAALPELENFVDYLRLREQGGRPVAPPASPSMPAAYVPAAAVASAPAPVHDESGAPPRETAVMVEQFKRDRRVHQLTIAGVMLVVIAGSLVVIIVSPSRQMATGAAEAPAAEATAAPQTSAPAATAPAEAAPAPTAPAPEDKTVVVYRLPKQQTLDDVGAILWPEGDVGPFILKANPGIAGVEAVLPAGTAVRIPRSFTYVVQRGDSLADIAENTLGLPELYKLIVEANKDVLPDPDQMEVGVALKVPLVTAELETRLAATSAPAPAAPPAPTTP